MTNNNLQRGPRGRYKRYLCDTDSEDEERVVPYSTRMRLKRKRLNNDESVSHQENISSEIEINLDNIVSTNDDPDVLEINTVDKNISTNNEIAPLELSENIELDDAYVESSTDEEEDFEYDVDLAASIACQEWNQNRDNNSSLLNRILNEGSETTVVIAVCNTLKLYVENKFTKKGLDDLLKFVKDILPQPNNYPKNRYMLDKFLSDIVPSHNIPAIKHRYCEFCWLYLGEWSNTSSMNQCKNCDSTSINGLFHVEYDLKSMLVDAFERRHLYLLMDEHNEKLKENSGCICDVSSGTEFQKLKFDATNNKYDVYLLWNTDGVPTSDSSKGQIWPIQVQVLNIPHKYRRNFQFVCSMYYSTEAKPTNMNAFLSPFVNSLQILFETGIDWYHAPSGKSINSKIIAPIAPLDAPARAAAANHMQYNGQFGCFYCEHPGESCASGKGHNFVFPPLGVTLPVRNKQGVLFQAASATINDLEHVKGVKGLSILSSLSYFDIVLGLVPDPMHCLPLGVVDMFLDLFFDSSNSNEQFYIKKREQKEISEFLLKINPPDSIKRIPRELKYRKYWKATEKMDFLLFYSPIILKEKLHNKYYKHYLTLVFAISILLKHKIYANELDLAEKLLLFFTSKVEELYGTRKCSFNLHQLRHLVYFVRCWGPMSEWTAFPFEDGNRYIKSLIHGTNKIDMEVANTIKYVNAFEILKSSLQLHYTNCPLVFPLGASCNHLLDEDNIAIIKNLNYFTDNNQKIDFNNINVYARMKIGNEIYTSEIYERQVRRNNFNIVTNDELFGVVKFYIETENLKLAILRRFVKNQSRNEKICNNNLNLDFSHYIIPIRETFCIKVIDCNDIRNKILRIKNYICLIPRGSERR